MWRAAPLRFLTLATVYPSFLRQFLGENPDLPELSYVDQVTRLDGSFYHLAQRLGPSLRATGHLAEEHFVTIEAMQRTWAKEKGVRLGCDTWLRDVVIAQVRHFAPDVILLQDVLGFDRAFRAEIRAAAGRDASLVGWCGVLPRNGAAVLDLDLVLTCVPSLVTRFHGEGIQAALLPWAFDPEVLNRVVVAGGRDIPFAFIGSLLNWAGLHGRRFGYVEQLLEETPLEVWGDISSPRGGGLVARCSGVLSYGANRVASACGMTSEVRARVPFLRRGAFWKHPPGGISLPHRFPGRVHGPVFGQPYFTLLARAQVVLNIHVDAASDYAGNLRLFEATGMGACLLTDAKSNLGDLFAPGSEVVAFRSAGEAAERVRHLLRHPNEARAIGEAGQRRTLRDHTFARRAERFLEILEDIRPTGRRGRE